MTNAAHATRIELLTKDNYDTWSVQVQALLIKNDAWGYVNGTKVKPHPGAGNEAQITMWQSNDEKARSDLILAISPSELKQVRGCQTSRELWLKLESIYASRGPARKATLLKRLTLQRMQDGEDVREHMTRFFDAVDKLGNMDVNINNDLLSIMLLYSLPSSYENFRCAIETRDELPAPDILKVKIIEEDNARRQSTALDIQGAMFVGRREKKFAKQRAKNDQKNQNSNKKDEMGENIIRRMKLEKHRVRLKSNVFNVASSGIKQLSVEIKL